MSAASWSGWRTGMGLLAALCGLALGCSRTPTDPTQRSSLIDATAKIAQAAAAVTGQDAPAANDYEKGKYVGFDTHTYPGTGVMRTWKQTPGSPYSWVGYYLPSPCHADRSWTGKRDTLIAMGWGLAAVYVGQQSWGKTPRSLSSSQLAALRKRTKCSTDLMNASEGIVDADDATSAAQTEGFPPRAIVFLDLERVETIPAPMRAYYTAWVERMLSNGRYEPGIYAHEHNAASIYTDVKNTFAAKGDTTTPRFWIAGGKGFDTGRAPQDVGFVFAGVWQGVIDVARSVANVRLPVDVNVASWASPSESGIETQ